MRTADLSFGSGSVLLENGRIRVASRLPVDAHRDHVPLRHSHDGRIVTPRLGKEREGHCVEAPRNRSVAASNRGGVEEHLPFHLVFSRKKQFSTSN